MDSKKLTKRLIYLIFFILVVNFLANKFYWYYSIWWLDMFMHFFGGFWIALAFLYVFPLKNEFISSVLKILFFVLLIGSGWEVFEMLVDDIFSVVSKNPFNFFDTLSDICFDVAGGAFAIFYFFKRIVLQSGNESR